MGHSEKLKANGREMWGRERVRARVRQNWSIV